MQRDETPFSQQSLNVFELSLPSENLALRERSKDRGLHALT